MIRAGEPVSRLCEALGVDPADARILRHVKTDESLDGPRAWERGRDTLRAYVSHQNIERSPYGRGVRYALHCLRASERPELGHADLGRAAVLVGVTEVIDTWTWRRGDERRPIGGWQADDGRAPGIDHQGSDHLWIEAAFPYEGRVVIAWPGTQGLFRRADNPNCTLLRVPEDTADEYPPPDPEMIFERRVAVLHRRLERRGGDAERVKALKGLRCEGCGLDALARFGAELAARCIEAHHLTPVAAAAEGRPIRSHPVDDFAVLCATCHRLIHGLEDPADLEALRRLARPGLDAAAGGGGG